MKKLFAFLLLFSACHIPQDVQVQGSYATLVKKTISFRGSNERTVQYWRKTDDKGSLVFWEMLPAGDTGYAVGTIQHVLTQR